MPDFGKSKQCLLDLSLRRKEQNILLQVLNNTLINNQLSVRLDWLHHYSYK